MQSENSKLSLKLSSQKQKRWNYQFRTAILYSVRRQRERKL